MDKKSNNSFIKEHPIIFNILLIIGTFFALMYISLFLIDIFTEHGEFKVVPNVKHLPLDEALNKIEVAGFRYEVMDSVYDNKLKAGAVAEQNPKANSRVKSNRIIYLSINAFSPKMVSFPNITEISVRQAQAMLEAIGIKNIRIESVYSPFKGLVIDSKMNGLSIHAGTKIPISSYITLQVGDGAEEVPPTDSISAGSSEPDVDFGNYNDEGHFQF